MTALSMPKITRCLVFLTLTGIVAWQGHSSLAPPAAFAAPALAKHCSIGAYKHGKCIVVPKSGRFLIPIPGSKHSLIGTGTPATAGTRITVARATVPHAKQHGYTFKLVASGPFPPLKPPKGTKLYQYNPANGNWKQISTVTGPGLYEVVSLHS